MINKKDFESCIKWIITNQDSSGAIFWDEGKKFDAWDHSECLIALAIFGEWQSFKKGIDFLINECNEHGLIKSESVNFAVTKDYFEPHHVAYVFLPILQKYYLDNDLEYLDDLWPFLSKVYKGMKDFQDEEGYFFWAKNENGFVDNSLITATCSLELSRRAFFKISKILKKNIPEDMRFISKDMIKSSKFNRDNVDRGRFSMDSYYPLLCNIGGEQEIETLLQKFYVNDKGIKCVIEEPWVTLAETAECVVSLKKNGKVEIAKKIFNNILQYKNDKGFYPTGYQFKMNIFWPDESSTWTNAAIVIAADAVHDLTGKKKVILD
jgi:hypothetical protein